MGIHFASTVCHICLKDIPHVLCDSYYGEHQLLNSVYKISNKPELGCNFSMLDHYSLLCVKEYFPDIYSRMQDRSSPTPNPNTAEPHNPKSNCDCDNCKGKKFEGLQLLANVVDNIEENSTKKLKTVSKPIKKRSTIFSRGENTPESSTKSPPSTERTSSVIVIPEEKRKSISRETKAQGVIHPSKEDNPSLNVEVPVLHKIKFSPSIFSSKGIKSQQTTKCFDRQKSILQDTTEKQSTSSSAGNSSSKSFLYSTEQFLAKRKRSHPELGPSTSFVGKKPSLQERIECGGSKFFKHTTTYFAKPVLQETKVPTFIFTTPEDSSSSSLKLIKNFPSTSENEKQKLFHKQEEKDPIPSTSRSQKTMICQHCGKLFTHRGDMNKHLRSHTGEQPFECSICKRKFTHTSNLSRHLRVHSGIKPFHCDRCNRDFSRKDKLVMHQKTKLCMKYSQTDTN